MYGERNCMFKCFTEKLLLLKPSNMFERVEISEIIYEGVVKTFI